MKHMSLFFLTALVCLLTAPAFAQTCDITKLQDSKGFISEKTIFEPVADLPVHFAVGLVIMEDGFAATDRMADDIIRFDSSGTEQGRIEFPAYEPSALSFNGELLAAADGENGRIYFLNPTTGECVRTISAPMQSVSGMAWDDAGRLWITAKGAKEIQQLDPLDGTTLADIPSPDAGISALEYDPKGYLWAADSKRDRIYLVDIRTGYTAFHIDAPGPVVNGLVLRDGILYAIDYQTDKLYRAGVDDLNGQTFRSDARHERVTVYSKVQNLGPGSVTGGTVAIAIPENGPNQDLDKVSWTTGAQLRSDQWGQRVAAYDIGTLKPGEWTTAKLSAEGTFYTISTKIYPHQVGKLSDIPADIRDAYLKDADKYRVNDPYIQNKVKELTAGETNPWVMARTLYEFLISRINYQMVGGWDIAPTVIKRGTGSCSEYTFSYVALCRAAGIPARYVGSVVVRGEDASTDKVYHRWAEIYLPNVGWIPVDVNAGDREWQGDRAFWMGGIQNRFLITTRGGGDSEGLQWDYNLTVHYRTIGKANVRVDGFGEWDVVK